MAKNILIYSDGTGQDGGVRPEQRVSNIYKMYRASRTAPDNQIDPADQVSFYDPGLGTDIGATALSAPRRFLQKILGSVVGRGIIQNIADCYAFIIDHYEPGDRIFLIGFSRGAYTVRSLANLLMLCGVPTKTPSGPLMRFRKQAHDIAMEAVTDVLEHGAGHPRSDFAAEREEQARRFREKYGSNGDYNSNVAPYFIGVFDTVAALGARGLIRIAIWSALFLSVFAASAIVSILPAIVIAKLLRYLLEWSFWATWAALVIFAATCMSVFWVHTQKKAQLKVIKDFPQEGDIHKHYAEWKGENFDRLLSVYVRYGRAANAIDENRKDFHRVEWGPVINAKAPSDGGPAQLIQMWFAGNHSDIGGSYPETESRLSDNALWWMVEQATSIPNGIKLGPIFINGVKIPNTGNAGTPLYIYPRPDGVQHCELASTRDVIDSYADKLPMWMGYLRKRLKNFNWPEEGRKIPRDAVVHESVRDRFELSSVMQCMGHGTYRPEALREHNKFKRYY